MLHYVHVGQTQPSDAKMRYKHQQQQQQRKMSIWGEDKKKNRYPCVVEGYYRDWIWRISFMYTYGWDRPAIWRAGILSVHSLYVRIRHKIALHVVDVCVCFCVSCDIDRWEASEWPWRRWRRRRNVRGDWMGKNSLIKEDFPLSLPSYVWKLQYLQTAIDNKNSLLENSSFFLLHVSRVCVCSVSNSHWPIEKYDCTLASPTSQPLPTNQQNEQNDDDGRRTWTMVSFNENNGRHVQHKREDFPMLPPCICVYRAGAVISNITISMSNVVWFKWISITTVCVTLSGGERQFLAGLWHSAPPHCSHRYQCPHSFRYRRHRRCQF